ncbi:MAG: four helix bundle protein [Rickettsiales bacterium]|nr:four helix bundle protein [Rickettsiales bacterium]
MEDLDVYKKSVKFAVDVYNVTKHYPSSESYGLVSQMRRAAVSIISNLSEGGARLTNGEQKQFMGIARGSAAELKTQIILSRELGFIKNENENLLRDITAIHKMITGLIKSEM